MSTRLAVLAGLVSGALAAALLLIALVVAVPDPGLAATPPPTVPPGSGPLPTPTPTGPPSATTGASATTGPTASGSGETIFHIGETAPPLFVPQAGGGSIDLAALRGKPVWVNFMATWCEPCIDEFPRMNGFAARYAESGLVIVAIDVREDESTVAAFAQRLGATFPMGLDADGAAQQAWGAFALPVHFWIDAKGVVRDGALGGIGQDLMAAGLQKILPGVEVTP